MAADAANAAQAPDNRSAEGSTVETFGCRLNIYESAVIREQTAAAGLTDVVVVNTCAVTATAERDARRRIRKLKRDRPDARIVVTGCAAQIAPDSFAGMPEVDHVIGNDRKLRLETWTALADAAAPPIAVDDIMAIDAPAAPLVTGFDQHTRAFLQVQNGCDHRCTFCIIPFGRGNSRSVPIGIVVDQARQLVAHGYREIVLTGVDITSYGPDLPGSPTLGQMIRRLLALVPGVERVRLSSLDPVEIDDDLWRLIAAEPRLMPHLHLSIQAGSDLILKRMKRRHLRHHVLEVVAKARALRPEMVFGADLIAGFPTETEADFQATMDLVREADLTFLHVFPYSEREGTPAARMPPVAPAIRKARAARLRALGEQQLMSQLARRVGAVTTILAENGPIGRDPCFLPVALPPALETPEARGRIARVRLTGIDREAGRLLCVPEDRPPTASRDPAASRSEARP